MVTVLLRHSKKLSLGGDFHLVFQLLCRLDYPETIDVMTLSGLRRIAEDISGILGPYMEAYIRRDGRYRDGLGIRVVFFSNSISIQVSTVSSITGII